MKGFVSIASPGLANNAKSPALNSSVPLPPQSATLPIEIRPAVFGTLLRAYPKRQPTHHPIPQVGCFGDGRRNDESNRLKPLTQRNRCVRSPLPGAQEWMKVEGACC